jgi:hypothetical protein
MDDRARITDLIVKRGFQSTSRLTAMAYSYKLGDNHNPETLVQSSAMLLRSTSSATRLSFVMLALWNGAE